MNDYINNEEKMRKTEKEGLRISKSEKIPGYNVPFPGAYNLSDNTNDSESDDVEIVLVSAKE